MATFKYLGETIGGLGNIEPLKLRIRKQDGTWIEFLPESPATTLVPGVYITPDITDPQCLRTMRADPRFEEQP